MGGTTSGVAPSIRSFSLDGADWLSRFADRTNPLVIREIRQGLRTRTFWSALAVMLLACVVTTLIAYGVHSERPLHTHGQEFFVAYFVILSLVLYLALPFNAFRSLTKEREDETWVLLNLTGLGPRRILFGKALSTVMQGALYASVILPFVVFSYFLDGISLPSILLVLALGIVHHMFLTVVAVSLATLGDNRVFRAGAQLACVMVLFTLFSLPVSLAGGATGGAGRLFGAEQLALWGGALLTEVAAAYLLLETAASRLMLITEDYTRRPRRAWLITLALTLVFSLTLGRFGGLTWEQALLLGTFVTAALAVTGAVLTATDRDGCAKKHRSASLLRPGALQGFSLGQLVLLGCSVALLGASVVLEGDEAMVAVGTGSAFAYVALYLSFNVFLTRWVTAFDLTSPLAQRLSLLALYTLGSGLPPLLGFVLGAKPSGELLNLLNPLVAPVLLAEGAEDGEAFAVAGFALLFSFSFVVALAARGALSAREREINQAMDGVDPSAAAVERAAA